MAPLDETAPRIAVRSPAPDPFLGRFGTRAGWIAGTFFYGPIRERGAATPEEVLVGARAIGSERWRRARRWGDERQIAQLEEVAQALRDDRDGALAFAAEALRRERMTPEERAEQKAQLAMEAAMRGKPATERQRAVLLRHGVDPPEDRYEASQLLDGLVNGSP